MRDITSDAAESLRILKRSVGNQFAALQVDQPQDNRRRAKIHRDAENRPGGAIHFDAVDQNSISIASDGRIKLELPIAERESKCVALDAHLPAPHGVAANMALCRR